MARNKDELGALGTPEVLVMLDKMRIQQIFFNLLSNAVKFTDEGGSVSVAMRRSAPASDDPWPPRAHGPGTRCGP